MITSADRFAYLSVWSRWSNVHYHSEYNDGHQKFDFHFSGKKNIENRQGNYFVSLQKIWWTIFLTSVDGSSVEFGNYSITR